MSNTTTRSWGIITSVSGVQAGITINSINTNDTVSSAQALNEQGKVTDICGYSQTETITVTGVLDSAKGSLVRAGAALTIGTKQYLITSVAKNESNTAFVQVTINAQTADDANIIVPSSSSSSSSSI